MANPTPKGLLLAMMEPPAGMEEEFQDWYDTEHFPERAGVEGFLTAQRFVCIDGWPRFLALYDLGEVGVLHGPAYAKVAGARYSAWTRRIIPKVWGLYRAEGVQRYPGQALLGEKGLCSRLTLWRFRNVPASAEAWVVEGFRDAFEKRAETTQVRIFSEAHGATADYFGIAELAAPIPPGEISLAAFGDGARHIDMINLYVPYLRHSAGGFPQTT